MATVPFREGTRPTPLPRLVKLVSVAVLKNALMGIPAVRAARVRSGRTTANPPNVDDLNTYALNLLEEVTRHTGSVEGKDILEIGPGDNLLSGLAFLAAGARSYTALDRFPGPYGSETARKWYRLLAENWAGGMPTDLDPDTFPDDERVSIIRKGVEGAVDIGQFDIICSYVVGEHVRDPKAFARLTSTALRPTGAAVHVIDFRGHEWDSPEDPFLFLRFPAWLWAMMGSNRGLPNRVRFEEYRSTFEHSGLSVSVPSCRYFDGTDHTSWATFVLRKQSL